eukprot:Lankesteria_metandrocarpae@DN4538_c0_g1_i1.p1
MGGDGELRDEAAGAWPSNRLHLEALAEARRAEQIWKSYLVGQSANVAKAAVWWSMFGVLVISLGGRDSAVGTSRMAFNLALVAVSPFASALVERTSVRRMLNFTTLGRMLVWSFGVPIGWVILNNYLKMKSTFWVYFVVLMFVDGVQVAFANVVDIDCGGLETLSWQYALPLNDRLRNRFNNLHQTVFDLSFVILTPPLAFLLYGASGHFGKYRERFSPWLGDDNGLAFVLFGISTILFILSLVSFWWYLTGMPKVSVLTVAASDNASVVHNGALSTTMSNPSEQNIELPSICAEALGRIMDVVEGFKIVLSCRSLRWRLLFLALETALEDATVSVVIPEVALFVTRFGGTRRSAFANLLAVCIIAVGKIGGLVSSSYMNATWNAPTSHSRNGPYRILFLCVFLSSFSVLLFPLGQILHDRGIISPSMALVLLFLGSFLFFFFSTAPKIGFTTLLLTLVGNQQIAGKVFAFVGTFVTIADALVITLVSAFFVYLGDAKSESKALVAVGVLYFLHGLLELIAGPYLVLEAHTNETDSEYSAEHGNENDFSNSVDQAHTATAF